MDIAHKEKTIYSTCFFCIRGFMKETDLERHATTHVKKETVCVCD